VAGQPEPRLQAVVESKNTIAAALKARKNLDFFISKVKIYLKTGAKLGIIPVKKQ